MLRVSNEVSYAILPGGKRMLVHDSDHKAQDGQRLRSSSRLIGHFKYSHSRLNGDTDSPPGKSAVADQRPSDPHPDSWGIMEEPLLPVGDWMPAIRLGTRPPQKSEEAPIQAPAAPDEKPLPLKVEIPATSARPSSEMETGTNTGSLPAESDQEADSPIHAPVPAPGVRPDRSGGIVGFLSRIFKT